MQYIGSNTPTKPQRFSKASVVTLREDKKPEAVCTAISKYTHKYPMLDVPSLENALDKLENRAENKI
jgi:hypothetical protein